jgi:hypothetical protein
MAQPDQGAGESEAGNRGREGEQDEAHHRDDVHRAQHHARAVAVIEDPGGQLHYRRCQEHTADDGADLRRPVAAARHQLRRHDRAAAAVDLHHGHVDPHEQHHAEQPGHGLWRKQT